MRRLDRRNLMLAAQFAAFVFLLAATNSSRAQSTSAPLQNASTGTVGSASNIVPAAQLQPADEFQAVLDRAIDLTGRRHLVANSNTPWQIFHYVLAMRQECQLRLGNNKVNAIEWLTTTEPQFDNQPLLIATPHGAKFHSFTQKWHFEGHPSQFLALLSESNLPADYPIHVQGKVLHLTDIINNTMMEVNTKEEVTWVLWALQHYLKPDAAWINQANESWSIERLVQMEAAAPIVGTYCGGNHRLFALTRARDKYLEHGGTLRGVWLQADQKIKQHIELARSLQNPDGSFSSKFYAGPMVSNDVNERFNTTGHIMEFLAISLPKERLQEDWVRRAVWMLSRELILHQTKQIDAGPLFHSLDALVLYRDRLRSKSTIPAEKPPEMARKPENTVSSLTPKSIQNETGEPLSAAPKTRTVPELATAPKIPRLAQVPSDMKPGNNKSTEAEPKTPSSKPSPLEVARKPAEINAAKTAAEPKLLDLDTKVGEPGTRANSIGVPEPLPEADAKRTEVKASTATSKKHPLDVPERATVKNTGLPKIDPSKLANIGQVAPTVRTQEPEPQRSASKPERATGKPVPVIPALLPETSATPLTEPKATSSANGNSPAEPIVTHDVASQTPSSPTTPVVPEAPAMAEPHSMDTEDAPTSALAPINQAMVNETK